MQSFKFNMYDIVRVKRYPIKYQVIDIRKMQNRENRYTIKQIDSDAIYKLNECELIKSNLKTKRG